MKKTSCLIILFISCFFFSCKKENVEGIVIDNTLLLSQSLSDNKELCSIIQSTLKGDYNSLRRLNHFSCGDGAGCYDLGYVITQIIYKIGESKFNEMVDKLDRKELFVMEGFISVGLEYGDNDYDGKKDGKKAEIEFPKLMKKLREK
jgi:hypothetical protein